MKFFSPGLLLFLFEYFSEYFLKINFLVIGKTNRIPITSVANPGNILPGFATDVIGILLVFPITRKLILRKYSEKYSKRNKSRPGEKNFIEGEYEDIEDKDGK